MMVILRSMIEFSFGYFSVFEDFEDHFSVFEVFLCKILIFFEKNIVLLK